MTTTTHPIKDFFTDSEWDLIYQLLESNYQYDDDEDYAEDYVTAIDKIRKLFEEVE